MSTHWNDKPETHSAVDEAEPPRTDKRREASKPDRDQERGHDEEQAKEGPDEGDEKKEQKPKGPPWYRRPLLAGLVIVLVIAALVGGTLWWRHSRNYEFTDDAFVDVISQRVSAQIPGRVLRVLVNDNQDVEVGTTLVELDPADYLSRVDQARASVTQAQAQLAQTQAQHVVYEAQLAQAKSNVGAAEANRTNVASELRRYRELRDNNAAAVSQQQLETSVASEASASAQVEVTKKAVAAADAQLGYVQSQREAAQAQIKSAQAQLEQAQLNLSYTQIKAQVGGRVARKTVAPGNNVQAGADLLAVVPREIYITANFKETQLAHIRRGQTVKISSDAYPDLKLTGKVESLQPGTGQAFSVLPAENATGNWVKVVQRLPVKIVLDSLSNDPDQRLSPGMSVEATVKVE